MIKNNFLIKKTHNLIFRQLLTFCHSVHYTDVRNYYLINFINCSLLSKKVIINIFTLMFNV